MNKVLLTGGSGFVGRRLTAALTLHETCLRLLSRCPQAGFDTVVCDLQTDLIPSNAMVGIDTVFHLAGYAHDLGNSSDVELMYHAVNVDATIKLLNQATRLGVKKFIYVSSVKAGGSPPSGTCLTELNQLEPDGVYGRTKRKAELAVLRAGQSSGMHVSIIRPSLVYGPRPKGNLRAMMLGIKKGWFPPLPEIGNRRSMIHIDDLVSALLLVAQDQRTNGEVYNATDGINYSSRTIYHAMRLAVGKQPTALSIPRELFAVAAWCGDRLGDWFPFDSYKMRKLLGDECYSSDKLRNLGFVPRFTLQNAMPDIVDSLHMGGEG